MSRDEVMFCVMLGCVIALMIGLFVVDHASTEKGFKKGYDVAMRHVGNCAYTKESWKRLREHIRRNNHG